MELNLRKAKAIAAKIQKVIDAETGRLVTTTEVSVFTPAGELPDTLSKAQQAFTATLDRIQRLEIIRNMLRNAVGLANARQTNISQTVTHQAMLRTRKARLEKLLAVAKPAQPVSILAEELEARKAAYHKQNESIYGDARATATFQVLPQEQIDALRQAIIDADRQITAFQDDLDRQNFVEQVGINDADYAFLQEVGVV